MEQEAMPSELPPGKIGLISAEGACFILDTNIAFLSQTLQIFFDSEFGFKESQTRVVCLPIRTRVLQRIVEFMEYKHRCHNDMNLPEFAISDEESMELLDVASYLRI